MKGGVTKRIEDTLKALDQGQLKKALILTEGVPRMEQHHAFVAEAGRTCLASQDDKQACDRAIKQAKDQIQATIELPENDTSLEGLEDLVAGVPPAEEGAPQTQRTDCEDCEIADTVGKFYAIAESCQNTAVINQIEKQVENPDTPPTTWLKMMVEIAEGDHCGQEHYRAELTDLTDYLEQRNSPFLKAIDEEGEHGQGAAVSSPAQGPG